MAFDWRPCHRRSMYPECVVDSLNRLAAPAGKRSRDDEAVIRFSFLILHIAKKSPALASILSGGRDRRAVALSAGTIGKQ